ncbi:AfsR/SARP family transcriptional regulator [Intrasporangium flavum]|uniref:AfsR/SARP family transcriptional regulator n=1 Tax=Intrasporangium flavum TaxID=1428657 RepID=UPI001A96128B|nr:BTAD domain-containing putative transcriptional regulator [Intrasporangium flavum]
MGDGRLVLGPRDLGGAKARQVLLALLFEGGASVSKDRLIEFLWGPTPPAGALGTLEAYVSVLRKRLAAVFPDAPPVVTVPGGYRWDVERAPVDVVEFARLATVARGARSLAAAVDAYAAALALVARPVTTVDADLPWVEQHVAGLHAQVLRVLTDAARLALDLGEPGRAETWARAAVDRDVLAEGAWQVLLESLDQQGRQAEALRAYERCRAVVLHELGCEPGAGLRAVFTRLLAATASGDDELRDLVDAVVRLHVGVLATAPARPASPESVEEDCRRLRTLLRAATATAPATATRGAGRVPGQRGARVTTAATA